GKTKFTLNAGNDKATFDDTDLAKIGAKYKFESSSISAPDYFAFFNNQGMLFLYKKNDDATYRDSPYKVKDRLTGEEWVFDEQGNMTNGVSRNSLASGNKGAENLSVNKSNAVTSNAEKANVPIKENKSEESTLHKHSQTLRKVEGA